MRFVSTNTSSVVGTAGSDELQGDSRFDNVASLIGSSAADSYKKLPSMLVFCGDKRVFRAGNKNKALFAGKPMAEILGPSDDAYGCTESAVEDERCVFLVTNTLTVSVTRQSELLDGRLCRWCPSHATTGRWRRF
jgi:hypothetical protein